MLFVEFRFLAFFLVVFGVYWTMRANPPRKLWLLACSYFFYGCWNWRYLFLIAFSTTVDFFVGRALENTTDPRTGALAVAEPGGESRVAGSVQILQFLHRVGAGFLSALGLHPHLGTLAFILPVGISFFTFQSLSYTIDVYRGHLRAVRNFLDLALAVSFFPQLVAGPITRAADFLPQLDAPRRYAEVDVKACLVLFLSGFVKKACISDAVAPTGGPVFRRAGKLRAAERVAGRAVLRGADLLRFQRLHRHGAGVRGSARIPAGVELRFSLPVAGHQPSSGGAGT